MSTTPEPRVQTIENAARADVRLDDHVTWEVTETLAGVTRTTRREGIAHHRDAFGNWCTKHGGDITIDEGEDVTITIRRPVQQLPTVPGDVIVTNDGHETITATHAGQTYHAREAVLLGGTNWLGAWRTEDCVHPYMSPASITPNTWKKADR